MNYAKVTTVFIDDTAGRLRSICAGFPGECSREWAHRLSMAETVTLAYQMASRCPLFVGPIQIVCEQMGA